MQNTMPDDFALLLATEAPAPNTSSLAMYGRKVRLVLPFVGAVVAVGVISTWTFGKYGYHLDKMSTNALTQEVEQKAYGYKDVGKGGCLLPNGTVPKNRYSGIKEDRAQSSCDRNPKCKGYVASSGCRGAFLYENPDGSVKGGGEPPKDSHSWRRVPCMAKDLSMVYTNEGYGKCVTADGTEPAHEFLPDVQDNGVEARTRCSNDPTCTGFSAATVNYKGAYLWKVGNLKAGGRAHKWNQASCYMKEVQVPTLPPMPTLPPVVLPTLPTLPPTSPTPAPPAAPTLPAPVTPAPAPTGDDVAYTNLGRGKCDKKKEDGKGLKHKWFGRGSERSIKAKCSKDAACFGYSASRYGGGLLWMEDGLQKGGSSWGGCSCMVKELPS